MLVRIKQWLEPPHFDGDEEKTRQAWLLNMLSLYFSFGLVLVMVIFVPFFAKQKIVVGMIGLGLLVLNGFCRHQMFRGRFDLARNLLIVSIWGVFQGVAFFSGGMNSPILFTIAATTIIIGLLFKWQIGTWLVFLSILAGLGIAVLQENDFALPAFFFSTPLTRWFWFAMALVFMASTMNLIVRNLEKTLAITRQQSAARQRAESTLRESEARFRSLTENSTDFTAIVDQEGIFRYVSPSHEHSWGYQLEELLGKNAFSFIHPDDLPGTIQEFAKGVAIPDTVATLEFRFRHKNGTWHQIEAVSRNLLHNPIIAGIIINSRDITERRRAEELLLIRMRLTEIAETSSLSELLQKTLNEVEALTQSSIGFYHFVEADQTTLSLQAWSTRTTKEFCTAQGKEPHYGVADVGVWADCVSQRGPIIHNDYTSLVNRKGMPEGHAQVVRELVVPILRNDLVVAILGVGNKLSDYDEKDVSIVKYLADVAWEIADRKRAEEALRASTAKLETLIQVSPLAITLLDANGNVQLWNPSAEQIFGWSATEILGHPYPIVPPDKQNEYHALSAQITQGKVLTDLETIRQRKDGSLVNVSISSAPTYDAVGNVVGRMAIVADITERKRTEKHLIKLNECLLSFGADPLENINQLTALGGELLDADCALYNRLEQGMLCSWGQWHTPPGYNPQDKPDGHICYDVIKLGSEKPFIVRHLAETPYAQSDPNVVPYQLQTYIGQVVKFNNQCVGSLCMVYQRDYIPTEDQQRLIGIIASAIAVEEKRKRAEEETALKNKQLTTLNQLGQALNSLAPLSETLERISDLIGQVIDNRNLYIALYDEATNYVSFPIYTVAGERKNSVAGRPLSNGLTESVIRARAPVLILDHVNEWLAERGVALIGTPCQCYLGVPILIDDHAIGVIAVQDYEQANVYNASHAELLSTIASQAAIAFENARLYEAVQQELVERRRAEEQLRHLSTHDALTSLYNRAFFESELVRIDQGREFPISLAVADVDNMKTTNDKLGHALGDELLKRAAQVLQSAFRKSDIIARIGGDEFAIIWPQTNAETAAQLLTRIQRNLIAFNQAHSDMLLQLSIGIATATTGNLAETLKLADAQMYEVKRTHKMAK